MKLSRFRANGSGLREELKSFRQTPSRNGRACCALVKLMSDSVQNAAVERALRTYCLMCNPSAESLRDAQEKLADYVALLASTGEHDLDRLTMCGLTFLRARDGRDNGDRGSASRRVFTGL